VPIVVIPAIDVSGGRLVRMTADGTVPIDAFDGDPLAAARSFVEAGATRLHVVDVDLATTGHAANIEVVRAIGDLGVPVQASGGVTSPAQVDAMLEAGADRVVVGSGALAFRDAVDAMVRHLGERVALGIEAEGPTIRPRGRGAELALWDTLQWLATLPVSRYLFTEVGRVSNLTGPDLDGIWALATHTGRPVIASGGIRSGDDVRAVAGLGGSVEGVVIGRALLEGLSFAEALAAAG
jgi:phosphoribosylformimino-5-aminoimidazole carboxamide ribonucleotide (ProFAR) isomerase